MENHIFSETVLKSNRKMENTVEDTRKAIEYNNQEKIGEVHLPERFLADFEQHISQILFVRQENNSLHNTFEWGYTFYENVKNHDLEGIRRLLQIPCEGWRIGVLGPDELRSSKNACICLISYVVQSALKDRLMDNEKMYSLCDACIQMIEESKNRREVILRTYGGLYVLTERIYEFRQSNYHYLVRRAKEYVYKHFHEKLTVESVAKSLKVSVPYLTRVFKDTESITLKQYIQKEKINRSKNMLRYSDYSIQTISQYLCFASQSHFTEVFKRFEGITPLCYRNQYSELYREEL